VLRATVAVVTVIAGTAVVGVAVAAQTSPAPKAAVAAKAAAPSPGRYKGLGFDACTAPSPSAMKAWAKSPYRAIVIYFGGNNRGCKQPNLTAAWVRTQQAAGWHLIPIYVGPQASCTRSKAKNLIKDATASAQGLAAATDAAAQAKNLGLVRDSVLTYDMESYRDDSPACREGVLSFLSTWTRRLHDLGYLSGVYSDMSSGIKDLVAVYHRAGFVRPDIIDFARWDDVATLSDVGIPAGYWSPQRRIKQFRGPHKETWGGVTINIDTDLVDVDVLPVTRLGDFSGNGWSDLLTLQPATGALDVLRGNGTTMVRGSLVSAWRGLNAVTRLGDVNRDGRDDVIARDAATGSLWLYPGTGTGLGRKIKLGAKWGAMREITAVGDLTGDGYADVLAVYAPTGKLMLYPGTGTGLRPGIALASKGWNTMDELTGVGDVTGDGVADVLAREIATGALRLYPGKPGTVAGFQPYRAVFAAAGGLRSLTGVGDLDRDGVPDLVAVDAATGDLHRYPVGGQALGDRVTVGSVPAGQLIF
jgi:hypothetical protein